MTSNQGGYTIKEMIELMWDDIKEIKTDVKTHNGRIVDNEKDIAFIKGSAKFWVIGIPLVISIMGIAAKLIW